MGFKQGLKSSGNAVPTRKFDLLVVRACVPTRKGLAKFTGALTTNDVSILGLLSKQHTAVSQCCQLSDGLILDHILHFLS